MKIDAYLGMGMTNLWAGAYNMPLGVAFSRMATYGYDGVELATSDLGKIEIDEVRKIAEANNLEIVALSTGLIREKHGLSFTDPSKKIRDEAVRKVIDMTELARSLDAGIVTIGLVRGRKQEDLPEQEAWTYIVKCLRKCGEYSEQYGVELAVEPETRYETGYINRVDEAVKLVNRVGVKSIKVMIDTFHMNIEESSMTESIKKGGRHLIHVHLADNNRQAPGMGHLDFTEIMETLKEVGYSRYLGLEILPEPDSDTALKTGIRHIRQILEDRT